MYSIYTLVDPRDYEVRYVGITNNLDRRLEEHRACRNGENANKDAWVKELQFQGLQPEASVIERCEDVEIALERELHWIRHYLSFGAALTNIVTWAWHKGGVYGKRKERPRMHEGLSDPPLLIREVAEQLGVSIAAVRYWIHKGRIDAFLVGDEYRISQSALDALMRKQAEENEGRGE